MTSLGTTPTMPSAVPFSDGKPLLAARREKGYRYVHIVTRFFNIHHTIAGKAYVARLVSPSTAKPPERFDAGRHQLSIGAFRTKSQPMKLAFHQKNSASCPRRQISCPFYLQTSALDEQFE